MIGTSKLSWSKKDYTRDLAMASVVPVNVVIFYIALSNVVQEAPAALFAISRKIASSIICTLLFWFTWHLKRVWNEQPNQRGQALWIGTRTQNALAVAFSYHLITLAVVGLLLAPVLLGLPQDIIKSFLSSYPDFTFTARNICVSFMFANNVAAFLATLVKYKVIVPRLVYSLILLGLNAGVAIPLLMNFFTVANGNMGYEWIRMITSWIDPAVFDFSSIFWPFLKS